MVEATSWSPMITTLVFSCAQGLIVWLLFERWRNRREYNHIYKPRATEKPTRTPQDPGPGKLAWGKAAKAVEDTELHRCVGMDTYVFLRFLRLGQKLCTLGAALGLLILVPIYATAKYPGGTDKGGFNSITCAAVEPGDVRLWAPVACMYVFVLYLLKLLWEEWVNFVPKRKDFLINGDRDTDAAFKYSALVQSIPKELQSEGALMEYFETEFPGKVVNAKMCLETGELDKLCAEREKVVIKLENAQASKEFKPEKEPMVRVGAPLCFGSKKEAIDHWQSELTRLNTECADEYDRLRALPPAESTSDNAFVSFVSLEAKMEVIVAQSESKLRVHIREAPEPEDMLWENTAVAEKMSMGKRVAMNAFWTVGMLFWAIPVAFVQAIANLEDTFGITYPPPLSDPVLYGIISGLLPVIFLQILLMLVPICINISARKVIKVKCASDADTYVFKWHFGYQIANLWLILLGGSLMTQLSDMIKDPTSIPKLLATAIPQQSQFFIQMLITSTFGGLMMTISQVVGVIVYRIMTKIFKEASKSQRTLEESRKPPFFKWGWIYPAFIFNLMIALFYLPITPLMLAFAWCNFTIAYIGFKYLALYVFVQRNEGGGALFYPLQSFIWGVLYMAEIVFIIYMGIKEGKAQSSTSIGILIITGIVHVFINLKYKIPSRDPKMILRAITEGKKEVSDEGEARVALNKYTQQSLVREEWETQPRPYRTVNSASSVNQAVI